jgi:hypothetical protein
MDPLLATGHISILVLVAGLFFPRLTLFLAWFFSAAPPNTLSTLGNVLLWLFVPRFLLAYDVYQDIGTHNFWFWAYLVTGVISLVGEPRMVHRRVVRRRVIRKGDGTTVIEEQEI